MTEAQLNWTDNLAAAPASRLAEIVLPSEPQRRYRLYVALAIAFYGLAWAIAIAQGVVKQRPIDFIQADARGFYAYLPAMVINGNLDFSAATRMRTGEVIGGGILDDHNEHGYVVNQWPMGVAITLLPAFLVAHGITWTLYQATGLDAFMPDGFTLFYQGLCLAWIIGLITAGMILADKLLQERFRIRGPAIAAAILSFWIGTHYAWYVFREPFMAHGVAAAWIIAVFFFVHRILQRIDNRDSEPIEARQWAGLFLALALCISMAITCRLTNAVLFPLFVYLLWRITRSGLLGRWLKILPIALIGVAPLVAYQVVLRVTTGQAVHTSVQGLGYRQNEVFYWTDPALVQSLISSRHGLLSWTPILLIAIWGLWLGLRRDGRWRDPMLVCGVLSLLMLWYINASWYAWWFGWSMGNRGFLDLGILFILGFGFAYDAWSRLGWGARRAVVTIAVIGVLVNYALVGAKLTDAIEEQDYPLKWEKRLSTGAWERF